MDKLTTIPMDYLLAALAVCFFLGLIAFILAAGSVASALKNIKSLFEKQVEAQQVGPQPFVVKEHTEFATREELEAVGAQVQVVDGDLKTLRREIVENGEKRRASIEGKVEAMRKECQQHTEHVRVELSDKLDGMEGRIIATLKNTGAI